jgi:hypothetical protein
MAPQSSFAVMVAFEDGRERELRALLASVQSAVRRCMPAMILGAGLLLGGCGNAPKTSRRVSGRLWAGFRPVAEDRAQRFLGKVGENRARCRGGVRAVELLRGPWVDWPHYWAICLGHPDGSVVDNVEDVDTVVGWLAEFPRPHGFAISETQLQVFTLNASRRLFSDRSFTSSFRPEFYGHLGVRWVTDNGPDGKVMEQEKPGGRAAEVSPLKRVLLRTIPELAGS